MKLIAIEGSQGSGKSTLLKAIEEKTKYTVFVDNIARTCKQLNFPNISMEEIYENSESVQEFQSLILSNKVNIEKKHLHNTIESNSEYVFVERSYASLFVYTLFNLGNKNTYSSFINDYYELCDAHQHSYYKIIYLPNEKFPIQADGIRPDNKHYANAVELLLTDTLSRMDNNFVEYITETDIDRRLAELKYLVEE